MVLVILVGKWGWYFGGWFILVIMGVVFIYLFGFKDFMVECIMD